MTQNSKAALPPSIGIYINAPVTSGGNCLIIVVLQLWCDVTFVLRLWCYALSAISRRLATAVAHLLYVMATSFFYIYIDIYIDIYKLTERAVVILNAIFQFKI